MTQENVVFDSLYTRGARIYAQGGVEGDSVHIYGGQQSGLRLYDVAENTKKKFGDGIQWYNCTVCTIILSTICRLTAPILFAVYSVKLLNLRHCDIYLKK